MAKKQLLIIANTPSENCRLMAEALLNGAQNQAISSVEARLMSPFDVDADMVLDSDALILFTTENFGYMSGALKDFFERIYYPCLEQEKRNQAKPFALVIKAGLDGTGTDIAVHKITTGLKWKEAQAVTLCRGEFRDSFIQDCHTLGLTIATSLDAQIL